MINNIDFISTDIDLDRDVPNYDDVYDHSLDTIDPDEAELPGPAIGTYGYNDFDVDVDENGPFITSSFDDYCDAHPDFNAALNGHWEYI